MDWDHDKSLNLLTESDSLLEEEMELSDFEISDSNLAIWRSDLTSGN